MEKIMEKNRYTSFLKLGPISPFFISQDSKQQQNMWILMYLEQHLLQRELSAGLAELQDLQK